MEALAILIIVFGVFSLVLILTPNDKLDDAFDTSQLSEDEKRRKNQIDKRKGKHR